ncbi:MAG: helix-turn-helix domain-containing protein [Lentisphaerae bacterium]|nr:helix-turn-helix domain-containing protein [Lentisphaerota bacterium]
MREFNDSNFSFYTGDLKFFVRSIGCCHQSAPHRQRIKTVDFAEIFWPLSGSGCFVDEQGRVTIVKPGSVWYYPPGAEHNYFPCAKGFHYRWLAIGGEDAAKLFSALHILPGLSAAGACPEELFCRITGNICYPDKQLQLLLDAFAILVKIAEGSTMAGDISQVPGEQIKKIIDENFHNPDLNVNFIAEQLHRHRVTVSKQFKDRFRINISDYLSSLRCQEGLRLLCQSDLPIVQIPQRCGFASLEYFYLTIRKATGDTPASIRKNAKHRTALKTR